MYDGPQVEALLLPHLLTRLYETTDSFMPIVDATVLPTTSSNLNVKESSIDRSILLIVGFSLS